MAEPDKEQRIQPAPVDPFRLDQSIQANVPLPEPPDWRMPPPAPGTLPGAGLALTLLLTINLFNYIDRQVLAALEPAIESEFFDSSAAATEKGPIESFIEWLAQAFMSATHLEGKRGYAEAMMGLLMSAFMFSYMITAPIFGWLAERTSRWLLIGVAVILWSLASGASGLAATFVMLLLTRCFVGIGEAAYGPAAPTVIADLYPVDKRSTMLGWFYMAIPVGSALGYVLGGQVLTWTSNAGKPGDWRMAFFLVVIPGILLGVCSLFMRDPPRGRSELASEPAQPRSGLKGYKTFLFTPSYVLNTLGMTAMTFATGGMAFWMPKFIFKVRGLYAEEGDAGLGKVNLIFGMIVVLAGLTATVLGGIAGDRLQRRWKGAYFVLSGVTMLLAFPMVLLVLWEAIPFPWTWLFIFLSVFFIYFSTGPTNTILANVTHPAVRERAFAFNIFCIHALGDAISPFIIGLVAGVTSMQDGFLVVSLAVLVSGLFWLWGARYLERDTALAPTRLDAH
jgi:MFS family permease